jgi:uncharacterized protein YbbK (DUF523 family)/putative lipoic acid-binding regulatory protein
MTMKKAKIGISACLLGFPLRYDGKHKLLDSRLRDALAPHVDFVSVCPETECGLGIPREKARLVGNPRYPRMITIETGVDLTRLILDWSAQRVAELGKEGLSGFIFKGSSPSCGLRQVRVFSPQGEAAGYGRGLFAHALTTRFPEMPVEEEWNLRDDDLRRDFLERVLSFHEKQQRQAALPDMQTTDKQQTFRELLDQCHTWPCSFPFKFIVPQEKLQEILLLFPEEKPSLRSSKGGKYVSVTINKRVHSSDEVLACYDRLAGTKGVICL